MEKLKGIFTTNERNIDIKYPRGSTLFIEGSPISGMYYLKKGKIKLSTYDQSGKEIIIKIISTGELVGHRCFFTREAYGMSATMMENSEVTFLEKKLIYEYLSKDPSLFESFIRLFGKELEEADHRAENLITKNVGERIAEFLLNFVTTFKHDGEELVSDFHLSREEIASIVGTSSETVTRYFTSFKEKGFLKEHNKMIQITEPLKLKEFSCH